MRNVGFLLAFTISLLPLTGGANNPPDGKAPPSPTRALSEIPLLVDKVEGLGLFLEEQNETRILLAGWARQQGLSVVDVERTQQIFARASAGEHAETGAKCGRPLPTFEIAERWHKELGAEGRLQAGASCKKSKCTLAVQVVDALDFDGKYLAEYAAPFAPKLPWRTSLPRALESLVRLTANDDGGGIMGISGLDGEVRALPERMSWTVWPARAQDGRDTATPRDYPADKLGLLMPRGADELHGCLSRDGQQVSVLLEVSTMGSIARCETEGAQDDSAGCVCRSLIHHGMVEAPLRGKRVYGTLRLDAADTVRPDGYLASAAIVTHVVRDKDRDGEARYRPLVSDPSIAAWQEPAPHALAGCFRDATGNANLDFGVRVTFDANGRATAIALGNGSGKPALTAAQAACVQGTFLTSRAPCPAVPQTTASANVEISFRPTAAAKRPAKP